MARSAVKIPRYRRKPKRSFLNKLVGTIVWTAIAFLAGSVLWVLAYKVVNPPMTLTMLGDRMAGRRLDQEWMPIEQIDRDMVRAVIAAEDSKFCRHDGFDWDAISDAARRNASGGRIRGGSTISQQTAKNAFLWQGGGYFRKGVEAYFTFLIENLWSKRRIMEVYLNVAETGIGTYGVNAGSERYYSHDASAMSRTEAARIAAVLPLPKERGAVTPKGFTKRYGNSITARIGVVARDELDACVYEGAPAPPEKNPPKSSKPTKLPGEDYESQRTLPPLEAAVNELGPPPPAALAPDPEPVAAPETEEPEPAVEPAIEATPPSEEAPPPPPQ
ncbi:monofunctional biosynthetic peptidoglycan transglycosylase [Sphingomonas piscis]|uniref:Biosynthetic peptidoglycan transglycosylase n=1 Tax=Sphingomonas piscis TaxID=2714943 RepID=A0A6G7YLD0_9SPHN|nr:monofunctional biosynthetic peptidoglycan transglycosylase [Sphingomonas piscis]